MKKFFGSLGIFLLLGGQLFAAALPEVKAHVNDYAGVMKAEQVRQLEEKLTAHERATSNQIAVLTMATLDGAVLESASIKICEKWRGGLKGKDNGTLLLVVVNDRKMRIEVGRGLEGALPDITCGHITKEMAPFFFNNDYNSGINRGVDNIMLAIKGEYKGTGKVVGQKNTNQNSWAGVVLIILFLAFLVVIFFDLLLCAIPEIGRFLSAFFNAVVFFLLVSWLLSIGWGIFAAVIGFLMGLLAPEIVEGMAEYSSGSGGSWSSSSDSGGGGGGDWGGGGGVFSGGGASGSW